MPFLAVNVAARGLFMLSFQHCVYYKSDALTLLAVAPWREPACQEGPRKAIVRLMVLSCWTGEW
jgi:hypothetical protein